MTFTNAKGAFGTPENAEPAIVSTTMPAPDTNQQQPDFRPNFDREQGAALERIRDQLARRGFILRRFADKRGFRGYIVSKWGLTRELHDLGEVGAFVRHVEGEA